MDIFVEYAIIYLVNELRKYILDQNLNVIQVVPVLAMDYDIDDEYVAKAFGLETLLKVMSETLPDELQDTLQNVQKASLKEKNVMHKLQ